MVRQSGKTACELLCPHPREHRPGSAQCLRVKLLWAVQTDPACPPHKRTAPGDMSPAHAMEALWPQEGGGWEALSHQVLRTAKANVRGSWVSSLYSLECSVRMLGSLLFVGWGCRTRSSYYKVKEDLSRYMWLKTSCTPARAQCELHLGQGTPCSPCSLGLASISKSLGPG